MSESTPIDIKATSEFQRKVKSLSKKYRHIKTDLQPILTRLSQGEKLGDPISGLKFTVYKLRIKNSDVQKGKSGGYRLIYWLEKAECIVLLDIYTKSQQENFEVRKIVQIIANFE